PVMQGKVHYFIQRPQEVQHALGPRSANGPQARFGRADRRARERAPELRTGSAAGSVWSLAAAERDGTAHLIGA
ncbi:hypothetical protein, partial [Methylobacterium crusticola]|uniref:hypothetical protein n=1 Tax=Methylobacterium crusticola TaxID=1697972 RepID=UPI001EE1BE9F